MVGRSVIEHSRRHTLHHRIAALHGDDRVDQDRRRAFARHRNPVLPAVDHDGNRSAGDYRGLASEYLFGPAETPRSEEHTSELQSRETISYAVFCLKKKNILAENL